MLGVKVQSLRPQTRECEGVKAKVNEQKETSKNAKA
jgi:hypothetical protein